RDGIPVDVLGQVRRLFIPISVVVAFVMAVSASALWMTFLKAMHGVAVGAQDSLFGRDIGFYMFTLPAVSAVLGMLDTLTIFSLLASAVVYWTRGDISFQVKRFAIAPHAARHIGALAILFFLLRAVRLWVVDTAALL